MSEAAPIFVLAAPCSYSPLIGAMVGRNPAAFGVAELNLFVADTLEGAWMEMARHMQVQMHGLLRTVAQLFAGEQSMAAVAMARRWVFRRMHWPTPRVFEEIRSRAEPFRIVEKSRVHLRDAEHLKRMAEACPDAYYLHVVRHPRTQAVAVAAGGEDAALFRSAADLGAARGGASSDNSWMEVEERIAAFLATVPDDRQVRIQAEELIAQPEAQLSGLCVALRLPSGADAISAMLHPERSPFAQMGPVGANFGDALQFLQSPQFRARSEEKVVLEGTLPWRKDGAGFTPEVLEHARALGYT